MAGMKHVRVQESLIVSACCHCSMMLSAPFVTHMGTNCIFHALRLLTKIRAHPIGVASLSGVKICVFVCSWNCMLERTMVQEPGDTPFEEPAVFKPQPSWAVSSYLLQRFSHFQCPCSNEFSAPHALTSVQGLLIPIFTPLVRLLASSPAHHFRKQKTGRH